MHVLFFVARLVVSSTSALFNIGLNNPPANRYDYPLQASYAPNGASWVYGRRIVGATQRPSRHRVLRA